MNKDSDSCTCLKNKYFSRRFYYKLDDSVIKGIDKYLKENSLSNPGEPGIHDFPDIASKALQEKLKRLEHAVWRLAAHGPGSGEINLRRLDDVAYETIADERFLKYKADSNKFEFEGIDLGGNISLVKSIRFDRDPSDVNKVNL